ncbi:hypothetical protein GCM10017655_39330 [Pseudomonas turukhanskensis]|jgi:transposase|uniref:Transposase n=1 Tax=Pseudomonas turukhanskensis TaxID=1806536 RepID=A0A9W6KA48_9PSED|nr:hypothetical protein GCM10017655_39330 [Pseudomonas turukhanskensis]
MISVPETLPDDPVALKQLLAEVLSSAQELAKDKDGQIEHLREQNALLIQRLFGRKSEQSADPDSQQLEFFNEAESLAEAAPEAATEEIEEEVVAPAKRRGKRKPLPAELPRVEVVHELPEHELTCECGCRKQPIGEETSEQLEIIPMQVRVIRHIRKTYACKACEAAPVTADKPAQLIEKSLASPSVLAMLLSTKYVDAIPLYRFEKMLSRHGIDIPRQTLARWVIQCGAQLQPLIAGNRLTGGHWKGQLLHAFALASADRKRAVAPVDRLQCQVGHFIATQAEVKQAACDGVITQFDRI